MTDAEDLEAFIQEQKSKIAKERKNLGLQPDKKSERKKWDKERVKEQLVVAPVNTWPASAPVNESPPAPAAAPCAVAPRARQGERKSPEESGLKLEGYSYQLKRQILQEEKKNDYNKWLNQPRERTPQASAQKVTLLLEDGQAQRGRAQEERRREYNDMLAKEMSPGPRHAVDLDEAGLPLGTYGQQRKLLDIERALEYNEMLQKMGPRHKENIPPATPEEGLVGKMGAYEDKRRKLQEERSKEYNKLIAGKNFRRTGQLSADGEGKTLPGLQDRLSAQERQRLQRNKEYNQLLEILERKAKQKEVTKATTPKEKEVERNREYNDFMKQKRDSKSHSNRPAEGRVQEEEGPKDKYMRQIEEEFLASLPGIRDHSSAEARKVQERNKEYNDLLQQKQLLQQQQRSRSQASRHHDDSDGEELPAFFRDNAAPRKGWATPTHDEILEKKRQEERNYRRNDDPELYGGMPLGGADYMRASRSDGHLNKPIDPEEEKRFRNLDREYEHKRTQFSGSRHGRLLEDPNWLDSSQPRSTRDPSYGVDDMYYETLARLRLKYDADFVDSVVDKLHQDQQARGRSRQDNSPPRRSQPDRGPERSRPPQRAAATDATPLYNPGPATGQRPQDHMYAGTLLVGQNTRASADQRRKEAYRKDLELQIQDSKSNKQREKQEELRVNATGEVDVGRRPERQQLPDGARSAPPLPLSDRRYSNPPSDRRRPNPAEDDFSPRKILFSDSRQQSAGILENGFQGLYQPSLLSRPTGGGGLLQASGQPSLGPYNSPQDEAYYYYGMRNPLDPSMDPQGGAGLAALPSNPDLARSTRAPVSSRRPTVTFDDRPQINEEPRRETGVKSPFPMDDGRNKKLEAQREYQLELQKQMAEGKQKKADDKRKQEAYDRKLDEEVRKYDPFGRGGGGAPMKDQEGNIIADLRQMHQENEDTLLSPRKIQLPLQDLAPSNQSALPKSDEENFARGGHGIFGDPMTDAQKNVRNKYQEELLKQIDDRKRAQEKEKEKEKEEEARLLARIEDDRRRIAQELEEEKRKEREKQEAAQRQQEELKRQQEERRKDEERKRMAADESHQAELRRLEEHERKQRQQQEEQTNRPASPPIPTLRQQTPKSPPLPSHKGKGARSRSDLSTPPNSPPVPTLKKDHPPVAAAADAPQANRGTSPPVPTLRKHSEPPPSPPVPAQKTHDRTPSRAPSTDVLNQLSRMRQQLQSERHRVESSLRKEKEEPQIYDARLSQKPTLPTGRTNIDIFEVARNREPVSVRRPQTDINPNNVTDFNELKNKTGSNSRHNFRKLFPDTPTNNDALETQQRVLLMQQEERLQQLRQGSTYEKALPNMNPKDLGLLRAGSVLSAAMLESESAFIDINNGGDDLANLARKDSVSTISRNSSARSRRRTLLSPTSYQDPSMGSQISLNPDKISRKNEERLRKLKSLAGDDISTGDPEDVLDRFMTKQQHNRPPSGQTLQDESWLRPGNA